MPGSGADCLSIGEYVAVADGEAATILVPRDSPVIQVGDINTGKWLKRPTVRSGHVYSWVMNNLWYANWPSYQEGAVQLVWSLTSHAGGFDKERAGRFSAASRVSVSAHDSAAQPEAAPS